MVQFLSIIFFFVFFNFCWVFQKFPFFVSLCIFLKDNEMRSQSALVGVYNKPLFILQRNRRCGMSMAQMPWLFSRLRHLVFCTCTRSLLITSNENQLCI